MAVRAACTMARSFIAEVHEPSATPPSTIWHASFPSPVLPPGLTCSEATPMPAQEPVLSIPSPARSTLSLSIYLTGPNTVCALPLSHMSLPVIDWTTLLPKPRCRLRLDHTIRLDPLTGSVLFPHAEPVFTQRLMAR